MADQIKIGDIVRLKTDEGPLMTVEFVQDEQLTSGKRTKATCVYWQSSSQTFMSKNLYVDSLKIVTP